MVFLVRAISFSSFCKKEVIHGEDYSKEFFYSHWNADDYIVTLYTFNNISMTIGGNTVEHNP